ncbi:hypothetical protein PM082_018227 [Marasmius tenuissimus]|nr:hypothetical protein PM082_018227 [Marasmius tenuissimus]
MSSHSSQRRSYWPPNEPPSLPGINEMFPEHFMKYTPNVRFVLKEQEDGSRPEDQRHGHPRDSHYASTSSTSISTSHAHGGNYSSRRQDPSSSPTPPPPSDREASDKKHVCPTCSKRFSRPSSLRIHVNTHTGETPFRCPFPGCGREFNVNSNMRRHYRNHAGAGSLYLQPDDNDEDGIDYPSPSTSPQQSHARWTPSSTMSSDPRNIPISRYTSTRDYPHHSSNGPRDPATRPWGPQ